MQQVDVPSTIRDTAQEESATLRYYFACMAYLDAFLNQSPTLAPADVRQRMSYLLQWLGAPESVSRDPHNEDIGIDIMLFGMIGKALFFLDGQSSGQFGREVYRLFQNLQQLRSNTWLFHSAAQLAAAGFDIHFIPERGSEGLKTPDYQAKRGDLTLYVEANARSQAYQQINEISRLLWEVLHGGADNGKAIKFASSQYDPGLIVVDTSGCNPFANSTGLPPRVKLRQDKFVSYSPRRWIYDTTQDPEFFTLPENQGNIVRYAIDYFRMLDKSTYYVRGILVGFAMRIVSQDDRISAPKGAFMVIDHQFPHLAIQELAPAIYLV